MARDRWAMGASESREELGALDAPGTVKGPKLIVCLLHAFSMTCSCILSGLNHRLLQPPVWGTNPASATSWLSNLGSVP